MKNIDSYTHTRGESIYVDDLPILGGTLFAAIFDAPLAHGKITKLDLTKAKAIAGVKHIITHKDIPGENQIGGIFPDEPALSDGDIHFRGQPIALVLATSKKIAHEAIKAIVMEASELPVIVDPREAAEKGELIGPVRTFKIGEVDKAWEQCAHIVEGRADCNGQEHLYIEGQGAYAFPVENDCIRVVSSTQGPTQVQRGIARVLGLAMHKIEVDVRRLGGGFGGKEDQATPFAVLAALGAFLSKKPVKLILDREEDLRMTGKRHPYTSDFKIGLDEQLKIIAYEADFYQNAGAAADLSPAVLERTLFHATNAYFVPNARLTARSCRTNLPPNTAFRGFGGPQGKFVMEAAITLAAEQIGVDRALIQKANLLQDGDEFSYGQIVENCEALKTWEQAAADFDLQGMRDRVTAFNAQHTTLKKGLAVMPICFGISFTNTPMNHARALVHVYQDGSVGVSTGAVEMGQGVNTKMLQIVAQTFAIAPERIKIETTNTTRVANTSPTAASAGADLNGKALQIACSAILLRLKTFVQQQFKLEQLETISLHDEWVYIDGQKTDWSWQQLVTNAFVARIQLSEKGHYATPRVKFDKTTEKGHPFAYHVYGTAITEVTVDCIRGIYEFDRVDIVHDFGQSMNKMIDKGQIEGGLVQGMGWVTMEELSYNQEGRLLSSALSTYKVPDVFSVPKVINVKFLETNHSNLAILKSKAVGEPPLMYGIGAHFAITDAIKAFNPNAKGLLSTPMTHERVLMALYDSFEQ
ncbi:xanthine dehydrogenase molybdopterin binding subunit [Aureispira anguillae]|uniref:Molybdopterin-dependent oxidoreductase n=1 Tax=Aureispira anguillae TaxID=2864201 RepID=A0A916DSE5_9BACT|nr:molybdopterin cofactor-binding domain-containing protein [Aureispira anguillae]BDS11826.1 molybdopterin-dependent oxidoreductase [Aureispira anguillae]